MNDLRRHGVLPTGLSLAWAAVTVSALCAAFVESPVAAEETVLPDAKPVPAVQVIPLPYDQASFEYRGVELTRYHFGPSLERPFLYPLIGPGGRGLTRMGHPHDPTGHSHHNSVWISHHDVGGVNFWADNAQGRIESQRIEQYTDGPDRAWLLAVNAWKQSSGPVVTADRGPDRVIMIERRRICIEPLADGQWRMLLDLQLEAPDDRPLTIGQTPFGMIGVRMAKTIGVQDGGGRLLNSEGLLGEPAIFRRPARWVDYSGPLTSRDDTGGITLMEHPSNPDHPSPFHVRADGWMGVCLTLNGPREILPDKPLRLRYCLWIHHGVPRGDQIEALWREFAAMQSPSMQRTP